MSDTEYTQEQERDNSLKEAFEYVKRIREGLQSENRFFVDEHFLKCMDFVFHEAEKTLHNGKHLYRARPIRNEEIKKELSGTQFEGFDAENSFVNSKSKWPTSGRMNPQGITVLYTASDVRTAVTEHHPYFGQTFSVATILVKEDLKIADLSTSYSALDDSFLRYFSLYIQEWISEGSGEKDYVFPQYISSLCQHLGYDGIGYRSKYATRSDVRNQKGINYTIFNYSKCEPIESKLYVASHISVRVEPTATRDNT